MEKKPTEAEGAVDEAAQKSDKSPQELMQQVSSADDSLNSGAKKSSMDEVVGASAGPSGDAPKPPQMSLIKRLMGLINIYILIFLLLLAVSGGIFVYSYFKNRDALNPDLETTELTEEALEELKTSDATVGDPRQILTIESHAVISGKVVMRDTLDVAGALNVGGPLSIQSIAASGEGNFGSVNTNDIQAAGNVAIGGLLDVTDSLSVGKDLSVAGKINGGGDFDLGGNATINGNLTIKGSILTETLQVSNMTYEKINSFGPVPTMAITGINGVAATGSISGTDVSGIITINTGGSGLGSGIMANIFFSSSYSSSNPRIVIAPSAVGCAALDYYVTNTTAGGFSLATASTVPAAVTCRFNYIVIN